jgi:clan AA aspartic protease
MITGVVNANLEATIPVAVQDFGGRIQQLEAIIDTGYNGFLTLTGPLVMALGLPWLRSITAQLADGSTHRIEVYGATVIRDGQARNLEVDVTDLHTLVGRALLAGYELRVAMVAGGSVTLDAIP